ncbi:MAG: Methylthioribulose-1-phosphate dehydratase [Holosporales bacterium]
MYSFEEEKLRHDVAIAYHIAAHMGWDDLIYGHISARIPSEPNCYLINPFGLMFDEVTPENLLKVDMDGNILSLNPYGYNPAGENIHNAVYVARPDIHGVVHLHTKNGMAISMTPDGILPLSQHSCHLMGRIATHDYEGIAVERSEQSRLVDDFGDKDIMILKNHGFLTIGKDLPQAFATMYMLEKTAQAQIIAQSMGVPLQRIPQPIVEKVMCQANDFGSNKNYKMEWDALVRMIERKKGVKQANRARSKIVHYEGIA